jgi:hypothetical protein
MAQTETSRTTSSPRPGIAVEWKAPQSATNYWTQDRMHFPDAVGPLTVSFEGAAFNVGSGRAFAEYSIPARMRMAIVNGYLYSTDEPVSADPAAMGEAGKQAEVRIKAASARLREAWENETLPELESDVAVLRAFDYAGASDSALADHLDWADRAASAPLVPPLQDRRSDVRPDRRVRGALPEPPHDRRRHRAVPPARRATESDDRRRPRTLAAEPAGGDVAEGP